MNSYPKHSSCRKKSEESVCSEFSSVISPSLPNNFMLLAPHFKRECVKKLMADFQNQMWSSFNGSDQLSVISWSGNQNSNCDIDDIDDLLETSLSESKTNEPICYSEKPMLFRSHKKSGKEPLWYDPSSYSFQKSECNPVLLLNVVQYDSDLKLLISGDDGGICQRFSVINIKRKYLQNSLRLMLIADLRFCQIEEVEEHIWRIAFLDVLEVLWKCFIKKPALRIQHQTFLLNIIIEGKSYFESLMEMLQQVHKFVLKDYPASEPLQFNGSVSLAINCCFKLQSYIANLARFRKIVLKSNMFVINNH